MRPAIFLNVCAAILLGLFHSHLHLNRINTGISRVAFLGFCFKQCGLFSLFAA